MLGSTIFLIIVYLKNENTEIGISLQKVTQKSIMEPNTEIIVAILE